jgi:uncharacterized protein YqhQ
METSNLIALGALAVTVIGLIPQFYQMLLRKKSKKKKMTRIAKAESNSDELNKEEEEKKSMPFPLTILMLVIFAVASFLIEIIIFGVIAYFFGVKVDWATMSLLWRAIFCSLFFIPCVFLFLAFLTFVGNLDD